MAIVTINDTNLSAIAEAIRGKNGLTDTYMPSEMAAAIDAIETGGVTPTGEISITENGTFDVTEFASALVNVAGGGSTGTKRQLLYERVSNSSKYDPYITTTLPFDRWNDVAAIALQPSTEYSSTQFIVLKRFNDVPLYGIGKCCTLMSYTGSISPCNDGTNTNYYISVFNGDVVKFRFYTTNTNTFGLSVAYVWYWEDAE